MQKLGSRKITLMPPPVRRAYLEHRLAQDKQSKQDLAKFASWVKSLRLAQGRTLEEVASAVGCSINQIHNIEAARNWPSMVVFIRLHRALRQKPLPFL